MRYTGHRITLSFHIIVYTTLSFPVLILKVPVNPLSFLTSQSFAGMGSTVRIFKICVIFSSLDYQILFSL